MREERERKGYVVRIVGRVVVLEVVLTVLRVFVFVLLLRGSAVVRGRRGRRNGRRKGSMVKDLRRDGG